MSISSLGSIREGDYRSLSHPEEISEIPMHAGRKSCNGISCFFKDQYAEHA